MNTPAKLAVYGLGLAVVFATAMGAGSLAAPYVPTAVEEAAHSTDGHAPAAPPPGGLEISHEGYTLDLDTFSGTPGEEEPLSFRILGPEGRPVTAFDESHDARMHLIVVGRDMAGYRHLHPEMDPDGTWSVPYEPSEPGPHRVITDFVPGEDGAGHTLGADLAVPGDYAPQPLPAPSSTARVDGYTVELRGDPSPGGDGALTFTVTRDGAAVDDLQPHLGAHGHLVALRAGDLAYLHAHPEERDGETGPDIAFRAGFPSAGDYRLFLDFKHAGKVHTAEFTIRVDASADGHDDSADPGH
ncbi:hypothetical protein ACQEU5_06995 [Marinactinospora thermotolerans]|uniref:Heavy-metal-associated domain-containing protein n=1 Tax=Marinactinospora thermotolerans DSM 45154 TaxID=1122192 RepID=A0A1T4R0Q1_9ACTN|nr:hypothetical protein [Marinactinospora thermotolerans]SKA09570.1 hypothetical protein SAMN02745673_02419 [Marinactinospora thermotolerans DSM 45154]